MSVVALKCPGDLEGHAHVQDLAHTQERRDRVLASHLWITFRPHAAKDETNT